MGTNRNGILWRLRNSGNRSNEFDSTIKSSSNSKGNGHTVNQMQTTSMDKELVLKNSEAFLSEDDNISIVSILDQSESSYMSSCECLSDFEESRLVEDNILNKFNQHPVGPASLEIPLSSISSSYANIPEMKHFVSVKDLKNNPGATTLDFTKFVLSKGKSKNLKYEIRKESRLKKTTKKKKTTASKKHPRSAGRRT